MQRNPTRESAGIMCIGRRLKKAVKNGVLEAMLAAMLCFAITLSLFSQSYSHGPGAWIEGQRVVAEVTIHGHSHDVTGHNATDHDHQNTEIAHAPETSDSGQYSPPATTPVVGALPDGIAGGGLRRPPRSVAV